MSWNYRVVRQIESGPQGGEEILKICEVYYHKDNETPRAFTDGAQPMSVNAGIEGLTWVLDKMREALSKPVLNEWEITAVMKEEVAAWLEKRKPQ